MDFTANYDKWNILTRKAKESTIKSIVAFYEEKTIQYILSNIKKKIKLNREKVKVEYVTRQSGEVTFGDNVVYIKNKVVDSDDKSFIYQVAQNTVCAVFLNLFSNTATSPNKRTSFGALAGNFTASITIEFVDSMTFAQDMLEQFAMQLGDTIEMAE